LVTHRRSLQRRVYQQLAIKHLTKLTKAKRY
jgi:hypothetical protein